MANPLVPLTSSEIQIVANLIKQQCGLHVPLHFKAITLKEPRKEHVVAFFEAQKQGRELPELERDAFVSYYITDSTSLFEALVSLTHKKVIKNKQLSHEFHGALDPAEMELVAGLMLEDETVKDAIARLELPAGAELVIEPWMYGSDGVNDARRQYQGFMFMRDPANSSEADSNHYAFPLPLSPVMDAATKKVVRVDRMPMGGDLNITPNDEIKPYKVHPPNEYITEAQESIRQDVKPLHVVQPEGVSFTVTPLGETGQIIEWQKWKFQVGFNHREGMVLYNVTYDGRDVFYRVALSEMNVPYGDPRAPFHRKAAFDLGDAGAGATANNLKLGCDCLGSIKYLDGIISDDKGNPVVMPNCICIHEQDNGIGWKHTNWRTGRAVAVRNRDEVRATGILSTQPIDDDVKTVTFGTVVHPGVLAAVHQHIFSLRIDPAIDGPSNRVMIEETYALPRDDKVNPYGVGYEVKETVVQVAGGHDLDYKVNRTFKIVNAAIKNPVNDKPVGYKIQVPPFQPMLADKDSFHFKRAEFADHSIYVTKYMPDEKFAGGLYTNQSRGGDGVRTWAKRKDSVIDADIVVWVQFGMNHIPRIEDFPVMPVEIIKVALKPVNFFNKSPAMDVPPSKQEVNKSVLVKGCSRI
ncbi:hypothetical protein N0V82_003454 [Gnomoniopsis sp. IMI 355080]|nr:hypothetical protein N0V82_003454 [Gnomoniopsis sp. IMI 355080]